MGFRR